MKEAMGGLFVRVVMFLGGAIFTILGLGVMALFGIPTDILYLLPRELARLIISDAPWIIAGGPGQSGSDGVMALLVPGVFVLFGIWSMGTALLGSVDSIRIRFGGGGDGL